MASNVTLRFSTIWLPWFLLLLLATYSPAAQSKTPSLGIIQKTPAINLDASNHNSSFTSQGLETFFYTQTLDHFNYKPESYTTFQQRYMVNFTYWGGANSSAPIFAYLGEETSLDNDVTGIGFLSDNAPRFKALLVYIEHRYYGKSIPFGSRKEAFSNASTLGYFSSTQAIADYAEVITSLKKNLSAESSPVIVIGGSYGGMLASWFRLKYPHIAIGALASSAPILYFEDITPHNGYYSIVTKDFREASENCYATIRDSWSEIDRVASQENGLSILSKNFKTCAPLNTSLNLKDFLETIYAEAAQYNRPPRNRLNRICEAIDGTSRTSDILSKIFAGVIAYMGDKECYDTNYFNYPTETQQGWNWQTCSEIVMPIDHGNNDTMFPPSSFNLTNYMMSCKKTYGVNPRPYWITTHFGGHDIKLVLKKFASNIIFSNGLKDPYSIGGVLSDISDSLLALTTIEGSHCRDIVNASPYDEDWLINQRQLEVKIIEGWIKNYYIDLATDH